MSLEIVVIKVVKDILVRNNCYYLFEFGETRRNKDMEVVMGTRIYCISPITFDGYEANYIIRKLLILAKESEQLKKRRYIITKKQKEVEQKKQIDIQQCQKIPFLKRINF